MKGRVLKLGIIALLMASLILSVNVVEATRNAMYYESPPTVIANWLSLELTHPTQISHDIIGYSVLGHPLYMFKVGNPNGGRVMWDGDIHGTEDTGTQSGYLFSQWLVTSGTARATKILNGNYFLVIPYVNYDGALNGWRVNKNGVNLNRNFVYNWANAGSSNPSDPSGNWRGPSAASEPETKAMRAAFITYHPKVYFNIHCGGGGAWGDGINTISKATVAAVDQRYYAEASAEGLSSHWTLSGGGMGAGFACSDAYVDGIAAYLVETQDWTTLPATLAQWKTSYYPNCFALIVSALEAVQTGNTNPPPSSGSGTIIATATKDNVQALITAWYDGYGSSGPAYSITFGQVTTGTHTVYAVCDGIQQSRSVNVANGATAEVEFNFTASSGGSGWSNMLTDIVTQIQSFMAGFHFSGVEWLLIAIAVVLVLFVVKD